MGTGCNWLRRMILLASGFLLFCSSASDEKQRQEVKAQLQEGMAAKVDEEVVTIAQVRELSLAAKVHPEEARSRLIYDALMAAGAKEAGYDQLEKVRIQQRSELARALLEKVKVQAQKAPVTKEEVAKYTEKHWLDMDRPVARKTTHAVVMVKDPEDETQRKKADAIAKEIAEAVRGEKDPEQFKKKAETIDGQGLEVLAQHLPPVAEDGRVADLTNRPPPGYPPSTFDKSFVKAAFSLANVGEQSPPFRSPFGTHVLLLVEVQPEAKLPFEKRRTMLDEEIRADRVRKSVDEIVSSLRQNTKPVVERNAEAVLQLLSEDWTEESP